MRACTTSSSRRRRWSRAPERRAAASLPGIAIGTVVGPWSVRGHTVDRCTVKRRIWSKVAPGDVSQVGRLPGAPAVIPPTRSPIPLTRPRRAFHAHGDMSESVVGMGRGRPIERRRSPLPLAGVKTAMQVAKAAPGQHLSSCGLTGGDHRPTARPSTGRRPSPLQAKSPGFQSGLAVEIATAGVDRAANADLLRHRFTDAGHLPLGGRP